MIVPLQKAMEKNPTVPFRADGGECVMNELSPLYSIGCRSPVLVAQNSKRATC